MTEFNDQFIMILNVDKVFTTDEISILKNTTEAKDSGSTEKGGSNKVKGLPKKSVSKK